MKITKAIALFVTAVMAVGCFAGCEKAEEQSSSKVEEEKTMEIRDISAKELVSEMKIGWNLGNTLDATGAEGLDAET